MEDGGLTELQLYEEQMRRTPRTLDKPPSHVKLNKLTDPTVCGYVESFKTLYNSYVGTVSAKEYGVLFPDGVTKVTCDERVFYVLKALVVANVCHDEEYSMACSQAFTKIVLSGNKHLDEQTFYQVLNTLPTPDYADACVVKAIRDLIFEDSAAVFEWHRLVNATMLYPNIRKVMEEEIIQNNYTVKELTKVLNAEYAKAKEDKEFMQKIVKGVPHKSVVGALYKHHVEHPEVLEVLDSGEGFMKGGS